MREFRIKVNNEKTYVVKANDYNQAVKTLHSKLRDFDLTNFLALKRSLELRIGEEIDFDKLEEYVNKLPKDKNGKKNVDVKEVIKCCIKAKDNAVSDSISRYTGEDAIKTNGFVKIKEDGDWTSYKYNGSDFDNAVFKIHQYNPSLIAFVSNGNRTITVRNKYLKDSSITDTDMKTAEDIIKKYGGNPVGNVIGLQKTRFVGQDEIKNQHDFAIDLDKAGYKFYLINGRYRISPKDSSIKDDLTMVEKYKKSIIYIDDNGYYYHTPIGGRGAKAQRDNTKDINIVKKRIDNDYSFLYDSSIKDVSYVSGKNLKIGQKIVEDGEVLEVVDIKETQRGVNNNYRDVTFKNVKTGATETVHFVNSALARLNDYSPKYNKGQKIQTSAGVHEIIGYDPVKADVHTNRIEYSYRLKTPNGTYTNIPDWQLEELVKLGRYKLIDSNISDKLIESGSKKALSKNIATEIKAGKDPKQAVAIAYSVQRENDASTGYKYRITNNGSKWYYETTFPDGHTTLTGPYLSRQETEQYFHKHRPTEKLTDADPVKVEKIIRKEKSALGITYYIFQTKSSSGYTIYYQVTDKTYHGEPTYSGGGIISFSLKSANDTLDHNLLSDKLKAKYGEKEGTKRYLRGENDSAIKDSNIKDAGEEIRYLEGMKFNGVPYTGWAVQHWTDGYYTFDGKKPYIPSGGKDALLSIFKQGGFIGQWKGIKPDKGFESYFRHSTAVPAVRDSNNIKNRKSYTIKVGDKQYKVFAESESEAINKYIKSKKQ